MTEESDGISSDSDFPVESQLQGGAKSHFNNKRIERFKIKIKIFETNCPLQTQAKK